MIKSRNTQQGAALLEVVVAMFILAIGILGMASLQFMSLKNSADANRYANATFFIDELAERIRSNPAGLQTYIDASGAIESTDSEPCYSACSHYQLAEADMIIMMNKMSQPFKGGSIEIESESLPLSTSSNIVTITLTWDALDDQFVRETYNKGDDEAQRSYVARVAL